MAACHDGPDPKGGELFSFVHVHVHLFNPFGASLMYTASFTFFSCRSVTVSSISTSSHSIAWAACQISQRLQVRRLPCAPSSQLLVIVTTNALNLIHGTWSFFWWNWVSDFFFLRTPHTKQKKQSPHSQARCILERYNASRQPVLQF